MYLPRLLIDRRARYALERLPEGHRAKVIQKLEQLSVIGVQLPSYVKRLRGNLYLFRVTPDLRAIFSLKRGSLLILDLVSHDRLQHARNWDQ
ncbi:MAG: hypothetical protein MN733_31375 [Nitrososphaera sp.]|nr:hypothetical protein [Nitrososphaera sp.]